MKIYILPTSSITRPKKQSFLYPEHNLDYGVEQDFLRYLKESKNLLVQESREADWHYLPIYWTRWHLNHEYGKTGVETLQNVVKSVLVDEKKTFTICQYDDGTLVDLGMTTVFLSSRKGKKGKDIPLLSADHTLPIFRPFVRYKGVFIGRSTTHPIRKKLLSVLHKRHEYLLLDKNIGTKKYVRAMLSARVALCPRGYGGSSFRFYEAMQLGIVPFLIGDIDTRPFKKQIDWDQISFYTQDVKEIDKMLSTISTDELKIMGQRAQETYYNELSYDKWCKHVLKELDQ